MKENIYLDNAASTPMDLEVIESMTHVMKNDYGNPSSTHKDGRNARTIIEEARKTIAHGLNASIGEIFFTSCGTESNNTILKRSIVDLGVTRIISSKIEHPCVLKSLESIGQSENVDVILLDTDNVGRIQPSTLSESLQENNQKTLVSIMHANNEIGTINNIQELGKICRENGALFHSDTVQTMTHIPIDVTELKIDFLIGSAHKFHGPKGAGFFYMNSDSIFKPFIDGGGQERNMRSGTENVYGIHGLSKAFELGIQNMDLRNNQIEEIRTYFKQQLEDNFPGITFNGCQENYLSTILSVRFPAHPKNEMLPMYLDIKGISASGGSACSSGSAQPSHVLEHLNIPKENKTIRFSFNHKNSKAEIDKTISALREILA